MSSFRPTIRPLLIASLIALAPGCAFDLAHVRYSPASLVVGTGTESFTLQQDVKIDKAPCNYDRTLRAGSTWTSVGSLPQGLVFRSNDQTLTVECSNVFEAYIVAKDSSLVGFYLPVEKGLVSLPQPVPLVTKSSTGVP